MARSAEKIFLTDSPLHFEWYASTLWGMLIQIFTLKFHAATERFDDNEVQEFIKGKEILSVREHFFIKQDTPYLALIITYMPGSTDMETSRRKKREAWRELLSDDQMPLFNTLRTWRTERAKREGVPPYVICTNQQLAQIAAARPDTLAGLAKIRGIGKAKVEKYGHNLLRILQPPYEAGSGEPVHPEDAATQLAETSDQKDLFNTDAASSISSEKEPE